MGYSPRDHTESDKTERLSTDRVITNLRTAAVGRGRLWEGCAETSVQCVQPKASLSCRSRAWAGRGWCRVEGVVLGLGRGVGGAEVSSGRAQEPP